jgi:hypothetical protein
MMLYAFGLFAYKGPLKGRNITFPFNALNRAAIAIVATCFSQWYKMDPDDPNVGFKKRILPVSTIFIVGFYLLNWIQPAEHHDATTSLALFTISVAGCPIAVFYSFDNMNFKIPILSEMGRNMLLLFIIAFAFDQYAGILVHNYRDLFIVYPILSMIFFGIIPIAAEALIAYSLARSRIIIKIELFFIFLAKLGPIERNTYIKI